MVMIHMIIYLWMDKVALCFYTFDIVFGRIAYFLVEKLTILSLATASCTITILSVLGTNSGVSEVTGFASNAMFAVVTFDKELAEGI